MTATENRRVIERYFENEARFRAIVENEPECVNIVDAECALLDMNPAGLRMIAAESMAVR